MIIHLITDQLTIGGGVEHIYQIVKNMKDVRFRIFARTDPSIKTTPECHQLEEKFNNLENVEVLDGSVSPEIILERDPDIVHFHHLRPLFYFFKNPLSVYNVPVVYTVHGLHVHKYEFSDKGFYSQLKNRVKYFLRYNLEKRIFSRTDRIIAVSKEDKSFMEDQYALNNVTYLANGIESPSAAILNRSREDLRKDLNLPLDWFLFVTVARFNFQKGYDILIRSLVHLKDFLTGRKIKFVLVGKGPEFGYIKKMAEKFSVSSYVSFLGERHDSHKLIKAGNVFLLPSRWEGLPLVLLECGFLKVPVIASDTYGNREVLAEENGLMFTNLDVQGLAMMIRNIINGKYDLEKFAENLNREVYSNYNIEKMISGLRQIYRSLVIQNSKN